MADLSLTVRQQHALRTLLQTTPVPGSPLASESVLLTIADLLPCDAIGVALADNQGTILADVALPRGYADDFPDDEPDGPDGPLYVGLIHWSRQPLAAEQCHALFAATDGIAVGFRNGADCVAQLWLDRTSTYFTDNDLAVLHMIMPVLQRLLRERPTPSLPTSLTVQERRVLMHVAAGHSNARIAEDLFVAQSTVRKHLEHAFRKLGVASRLAAVAALQGRDAPDQDLKERISRLG